MSITELDLSQITSVAILLSHLLELAPETFKKTAKSHAKHFAYDGFNAIEILNAFFTLFKKNNDSEEALSDICDIVSIGLMRGNIRKDQLEKTSKKGRERIEELVEKYNIVIKKGKNDKIALTNSTLTFTRAISIFPYVASQIIHSGVCVIEPTGCKFGTDELPNEFKHSGFASLIPRGNNYSVVLFQCYVAYMISFGRKINPNNKDDDKTWYIKQRQFSQAAWMNMSLTDNKYRIKAFEQLGLNSHTKYGSVYLKVCNNLRKVIGEEPITEDNIKSEIVDGLIRIIG